MSSSYDTQLTIEQTEKQSPRIVGQFKDAAGTPIPAASLTTVKFTLYDEAGGPSAIINNRDNINVLNQNGGTVDASGNFVLQLTLSDQPIVNTDRLIERHVAVILWTYNSGAQGGVAKISWPVRNEAAL